MIDNKEHEEILEILEFMEDEQRAVRLLKEFNDKTAALGKLLLNRDQSLDHNQWKELCDKAKAEVDQLIKEIKS